ncbi:hypothetical protein GLE_4291 [Lysobacter enzymogenes]|uniref:Uncharacterized protein n=1 Tax=Lysobacter enzymogenes TaxID=69 RepID=A0A0S2DM57_LYSEN|nr:hypothetical protein GLE_4291 [Lysobacter enzymogenes]
MRAGARGHAWPREVAPRSALARSRLAPLLQGLRPVRIRL